MESIGVHELRRRAGRWLRRVAEGHSYQITVRGMPVACLSPVRETEDVLERLVYEGKASVPAEDLTERLRRLGPPPLSPGTLLSDRLAELRRYER